MKTLALILALTTSPALADEVWQQIDTTTPATGLPSSYWVASPGGMQVEVHCAGEGRLAMVLFGGNTTLPEAVQLEAEFQLVYRLAPSGLTRSADGSWLGPFDNALNGTFPSDPEFLDAFQTSETMAILGPGMAPLLTMPMTGANWARFGFGEVCGL